MTDAELSIWMWLGGVLVISDWLTSTPHQHMALQVVIGIDAPVGIKLADRWRETRGVVVDAGVEHGFDGSAGMHAVLHVGAETIPAAHLRERVLQGASTRMLDADAATEVGAELQPLVGAAPSCEEVRKCFCAVIAAITGQRGTDPEATPVDERLDPVIQRLRRISEPTPAVADLAAMAHLSESRLQHLFREQMGMPIIRYALWQRMMAAAELLAAGHTATSAAHRAGFADSAHLAREFRRFNGQSPTSLGSLAEAVTVCHMQP